MKKSTSLQKQATSFAKAIKRFDYTLSGRDPVWKILFPVSGRKWHFLSVLKYGKTLYFQLHTDEEDIGSLEVENGRQVRFSSNQFSHHQQLEPYEENVKEWTEVLTAANKWLAATEKNWMKCNRVVYEQYPLEYRYGTIPGSVVRATFADFYRLDKAVGKARTKQFIKLVEKGHFYPSETGLATSMTANQYFNYCKIAYIAAAAKKDDLDSSKSGRELYKRFADGRHEGLLDIDPKSEKEFADWLDGSHPKRERGGHPWEINAVVTLPISACEFNNHLILTKKVL